MLMMDRAQEVILNKLRLQEPMNAVIDRGDSPIQQFYNGTTVFVTGGSGFMGKHLIEKLLRSCAIKKIYLLLRPKKGKTIQERLQYVLSDPVYDLLRVKQPLFADKIVPVEGDVGDVRLGLSDIDWSKITNEANIIFHAAATVRFDEPLKLATLTNVRGTRDTLVLARACSNLKSYVYISTAYTSATKDRIDKDVFEQFYPSPVSPEALISLAEDLDEDRLNGITNNFINGWPNTYTFTKAVAEEQIRTSAKDLPTCVVRPPIVLSAYYEPSPGWLDMSAVMGPSGILLLSILGVMHVFRVDKYVKMAISPVDYVNNAIIGAGWDTTQRRSTGDTDIPIYTVSNKDKFVCFDEITRILNKYVRFSTDKAVYMCGVIHCRSYQIYWLLSWLFHYIPAYILDAVCTLAGRKPALIKSFVDVYRKIDKIVTIYDIYLSYQWNFHDGNVKLMINRMSDADRAIYNCDMATFDIPDYLLVWFLGIRKYIIKDGLNNTEFAYKKQKMFMVLNYILLIIYAYVFYCILRCIYNFLFFF